MTSNAATKALGFLCATLLMVTSLGSGEAGDGTGGSLAPDEQAALESHSQAVQGPAFQALRDALATHPGFLALFPADGTLHAAYSGDAPEPSPLWTIPAGWSLQIHGNAQPQPMSHYMPDVDLTDLARPLTDGQPPNPLDLNNIRPGSLILTSFQGLPGTFICTLAFVMKDQDTGRYYAATAGHCLLPEGTRATHGSDADWDPAKTSVLVCVDGCLFGGQLSFFNADLRGLGSVVYARQESNTPSLPGNVGNDFGLVEIHPFWYTFFDDVTPKMAMWDGPVGLNGFEGTGNSLVHYGNGITTGSFFATKGRAGVSLNDGNSWTWQASADVMPGDSGSPFSHAQFVPGGDVLRGENALGVLTHGIGVLGVPVTGLAFGTPLHRGMMMAFNDADLLTELVHAGTPLNQPPTAAFTAACAGLSCSFDGTASSDPDGSVASYSWDFGDGTTATGADPSHTYGASDTYTVELTVRDDGGTVSDPTTKSITVTNTAPTARFTLSCTDLACTFDGTGSSDPDGTIASYQWDFGDGDTSPGATASHTYGAAGTYAVDLTVADNAGGTDTQTQNATATAPPADITLSATGHRVGGVHHADLAWSGATSQDVDVYRDGALVATTANDGAYTDDTGQKGGNASYTYQVCEAGTATCSNEATVIF